MMCSYTYRRKAGFTLTETVVATLLSVIVVASVYKLLCNTICTSRNTANRMSALYEARAATEYLHALDYDNDYLDEGSWSLTGTTNTSIANVDCSYTVDEDDDGDIKTITVQTYWENTFTGAQKELELVSMICRALHN